jgi:transcription antitermination factor NusG
MSFWACARVDPKREAVAQHFLQLRGFESYVPRVRERRLRGGRHVVTLVPLFPCYCFVAVENGWWDARWCVGVVGLIMNRTRPAVVADGIIDAIREREIRGAVELPVRPLRRGDRVRVLRGPFCELEGLFAGQAAHDRVAILLSLLGGHQRVTLPKDDVEAM